MEYRRAESLAMHALNSLATSDFFFLIEGKPQELVIPDGSTPVEVALLQQESRRKFAAYTDVYGYPDTTGLSLNEAFESCLLHLIQSYPAVNWRGIIDCLNTEHVPAVFVPSVQRDSTIEEDLVREQRLVNDLNEYTQQAHVLTTGDTQRFLRSEYGVNPDEILAKASDLEPVLFNAESADGMRGRLSYYRREMEILATEEFFFDSHYDLSSDIEAIRLMEVIDAYSQALNDVTGKSSEESDDDADTDTHEVVEALDPLEAPVSADKAQSERLARELVKATENGAEKLADAGSADREYLTPQEVADMLQKPLRTIWAHLRTGRIPGFKVGNQYRIKRAAFEQWQQSGGTVSQPKQGAPEFDYFSPDFDPGF